MIPARVDLERNSRNVVFDFLYSIDYICCMYSVKTVPEFDKWLNSLKDRITRLRLSRRLSTRHSVATSVM
jgi:hypothetical protein